MEAYEKLGAFYLGKTYDLQKGEVNKEDVLLYDSKDLTTHGVCVGMTGSGKTGLCLGLLEEAAMDGIPAIAIDPKGDLANLMLTFPDLKASDFRPWIDESDATRKGMSPDEFATSTAKMWKKGLGDWQQDGDRIQALREKCEVAIYTPGSTAGLPLTVLRSFDAPPKEIAEDPEAMRDRIQSAVSGLLALLSITGDPLQSREHILLSNILMSAWQDGKNLDLPGLIREIQKPPFDKIGVFDLESFYPAGERFGLAMTINNLLASPGFATWMQGESLDIKKLMHTPEGKPRIAIMSIAHLTESERMFFVTILLNEMVAWMRTQAGTSSLRALLYMDEIFGYFPPTANPPSKKPMLTLLKQARAYGLGVMLATQNPVDLDYKGLSNTGTWFIGRLQTERDKMRVLDGLEGASASSGTRFDRQKMEETLAGLGSRVFLMNNVHDDEPVIFHTRWVMSYLRGPMTRAHIKILMKDKKALAAVAPVVATSASGTTATAAAALPAEAPPEEEKKNERPVLPSGISEYFLPLKQACGSGSRLVYRPVIAGNTKLHYKSSTAKLDDWIEMSCLAQVPEKRPDIEWDEADYFNGVEFDFDHDPEEGAEFGVLATPATGSKNYTAWEKELKAHIYQERWLKLYKCADLKEVSSINESEGEFRGRLHHAANEKRDLSVEKLKTKYASKLSTLHDRIRSAEAKIEREAEQYKSAKMQSAISIGSSILGAFLGRKLTSSRNVGRAVTAARGIGRAGSQKGDIARAEEDLKVQQEKLRDMERAFEDDVNELEATFAVDALEIDSIDVRPMKTDITIRDFGLCWTPWRVTSDGIAEPLWE
ncbi:MAG: hypothetical protein ACI9QL_002055 [Candidatus Omnitrophota bacterium]|jgi:hypothetical protein